MDALIPLLNLSNSYDATYAQSILNASGIRCILENTKSNLPSVYGGFRIQIYANDYEKAYAAIVESSNLQPIQYNSIPQTGNQPEVIDDYANRFAYNRFVDESDNEPMAEEPEKPKLETLVWEKIVTTAGAGFIVILIIKFIIKLIISSL